MPLAWSTPLLPWLPISLEMLSRPRKSLTQCSCLSLPLSLGRKGRPREKHVPSCSGPYLHIDCLLFLTPEILPIVADARVRAKLHLHTGRIVPFRVQRISLVLGGTPARGLCRHSRRVSRSGSVSCWSVGRNSALHRDRDGWDKTVSSRIDRQELIESLSAFRDCVSTCDIDFTAELPTARPN